MLVVRPKLNQILKSRGITQAELSKMSGVPQGSISRFDRNRRHLADHMFLIADALDISVDELFYVNRKQDERPRQLSG